jgi:quercetin dioxygenase-like cupin family protein
MDKLLRRLDTPFMRFLLVGGVNTALGYLVTLLLHYGLHLNVQLAQVDILEALGTNLKEFFTDEPKEQIVFTENEFFETVNDELGFTLNWVIPNAQKNAMEPILLTLPQGAESRRVGPHEGEEFGYVLSGAVILHVGEEAHPIKRGQTFYIDGGSVHYIQNKGKRTAEVLWVSTPPVF